MTEKLEFIIDSKRNYIGVAQNIGDNTRLKNIVISVPYQVKFDPKHSNLINIILDSGKKHDDIIMNSFKRTFEDKIGKEYPDITVITHYSRKENNNVAEIHIPTKYDLKIVR